MSAMPIYDIGEFGIFWIPPYFVLLSITFCSEIPFFWEIHARISQLIQSGSGRMQRSDRYPELTPLSEHVGPPLMTGPIFQTDFQTNFGPFVLRYSVTAAMTKGCWHVELRTISF
jgi:hypothetical protein